MLRIGKFKAFGLTSATALLGLALSAPGLQAQKVNDAVGDFLSGYGGPKTGDLDVVSSQVFFDGTRFAFTATMNAPIGTTAGAFYVWGLNKGSGTAGFATIAPGVLFDAVVVVRPGSGAAVGGVAVNDFFYFSGNTITAVVPLSFFPGTGFTPANYTWNLWPRATGPAGNAAISDFAPDNSNNALTLGVIPAAVLATPEPSSAVLLGLGILALGTAVRRRRAAYPTSRALDA